MSKLRSFAVVLLVSLCALSSYKSWQKAPSLHGPADRHNDELSLNEARFAPVRDYLPQHQIICYAPLPNTETVARYYMAEYALVPAILAREEGCSLTLENDFSDSPGTASVSAASHSMKIVRNFGNGLILRRARNDHR